MNKDIQQRSKPKAVSFSASWSEIENIICNPLPSCVKTILSACGYDSLLGVNQLNDTTLDEMEQFVDKDLHITAKLACCNADTYRNLGKFRFLPGHRILILRLPGYINDIFERKWTTSDNEWTQQQAIVIDKSDRGKTSEYSALLKMLIQSAEENTGISKYRYDEILQLVSTYIFLSSGRSSYDFLSNNLPIPSKHTILARIREKNRRIIEGELRCEQLKKYCEALNVDKDVWISEDGSGIVSNIHYDSISNQLVGFVLPSNSKTGSPIPFSFGAGNAAEIIKHMSESNLRKSSLVYLVMAQPLSEKVPPFILQIFGTDNRFFKEDVVKRWNYTQSELAKNGIREVGISSDGDHRLLASMLYQINQGVHYKFVQDMTHVATKLRNRGLKTSIVLPLGNKQISFAHLKILVNSTVPKSIHGLTISDIDPKDRQNYRSFEKITSERVRNALSEYVMDSEGTVKFLEKCHQITSSFMQYDLTPLARVYRIWNAVYFLRIWRSWINSTRSSNVEERAVHTDAPGYTIGNNFITSNCYNCIEINAAALIELMKQFRDENTPEKFLPPIFDSQICEKMFRHFRSMGTANYTKINFTMVELLNMARRVEIKNSIEQSELADVKIAFLKSNKAARIEIFNLPFDEEIDQTLLRAKAYAIEEAVKFGMTVTPEDIDEFRFSMPKWTEGCIQSDGENFHPESDDEFEMYSDACTVELDEYANNDLDESSSYALVTNEKGDVNHIRKSALVWALSDPSRKLSNDRVVRVTASGQRDAHGSRRNQPRTAVRVENKDISDSPVQVLDEMNIGDWCFFKTEKQEQVLLGIVLRFQYADRKFAKDKFYAGDSVFLSVESSNAIETLCTFYHLEDDGNLSWFPNNHLSKNITNYLATLVGIKPEVGNGKIFFNFVDFEIIRERLKKIELDL